MKAITKNPPETVTTLCGHTVLVAKKAGRALRIERLLNQDGLYGTVTTHGTIYKRTHDELVKALRWVYDVREVVVVKTTLIA